MQCKTSPFACQSAHFDGVINHPLFTVNPHYTWTVGLTRLRHEKEILENGLANCVTYLHVLRKKQARNERLLSLDSLSTRKRRRTIQQSKRELDREIRNRQRDEQAFLSNLQTCKANIYIAEGLPYTPTGFSSTVADCTSSTTQYSCDDSEPTEISWNGWTEDAIPSPFEKRRSNPFLVHEVAPDELVLEPEYDTMRVQDIRRPLPLVRNADETVALLVPPNSAHSQYCYSSLSPEAATYDPNINPNGRVDSVMASPLKTTNHARAMEARRYTTAGITQSFQGLSIHTPSHLSSVRNHTWCNNTPQQSPRKDKRCRSNSL